MSESSDNARVEKIAGLMEKDGISPDEQDSTKFAKYRRYAVQNLGAGKDEAVRLVYESLLYLKLKNSKSADPLQDGDKFGVGFS